MSYVIESHIPAPEPMERGKRAPTAVRAAMESLKPGQSFLMLTVEEYDRARSASCYLGGRFVTRKIPGEGWRLWRIA